MSNAFEISVILSPPVIEATDDKHLEIGFYFYDRNELNGFGEITLGMQKQRRKKILIRGCSERKSAERVSGFTDRVMNLNARF